MLTKMQACTSVLILLLLPATLQAQSNSKGKNSPVVVGFLKSANGNELQVLQSGELLRKLVLGPKSQIHYVGMQDQNDHHPVPGYGVKAKVGKDGSIKSILFTHPIGKKVRLGERRLTMSERDLFEKVDVDRNGKVSYAEFAQSIYDSPKHGPDGFRKNDKDGDGGLNQEEFKRSLITVAWWELSRKTPADWMTTADLDNNRKLTLEEFKTICSGGNHIDNVFRRTDKDNSGDLSHNEVTAYIESVTAEK